MDTEGGGFKPSIEYDQEYKSHQVNQVKERLGIAITKDDSDLTKSWSELRAEQPEMSEIYLRALRNIGRERNGHITPIKEILEDRSKVLQIHLSDFISKHSESDSPGKLRPYQMDVFKAITDSLDEDFNSGYVKLPTGTGKTVLFTKFLEAAKMKTLLVVPSKVLVDQTGEKVDTYTTDLDVGKIFSESKKHGEDVTITTYDSLVSSVAKGTIKPEDYGLLVLDEAHRALSEGRIETINKFTQSVKLGFTATPKFNEKKQVSNLLPREIFSMSIEEAANLGVIATFLPYVVETSLDLSKVSVEDGEYNLRELEEAVNIKGRNLAAVEVYKSQPELHDKTAVAYCVGVTHATDLAKEFVEQGVRAAVISGSTPKNERKEILKAYKSGKIQVLCNADLLIEGFDEPRATVCLNLRPTKSLVVAEQRAGRVLRLDKNNPDKIAYIIDFLDSGGENKKNPLLFRDIVTMTDIDIPSSPVRDTLVKQLELNKEEAEGELINVEGLQVRLHVSMDDVLNVGKNEIREISRSEKQPVEKIIPWLTWEEIKDTYKLPEESKVLIEHSAAWRPKTKRSREGVSGIETEYHPHAIERACSQIVIREIIDHINEIVRQNEVIPAAVIKVFMEESMLVDTDIVIEFMQFVSSDEKKAITDANALRDSFEEKKLLKRLRDFHEMHRRTLQGSQRFKQAGIEARELVA